MLQVDSQLFSDATALCGSELSRQIAGSILSDCNRPDWDTSDLAHKLESVYHSEGPAVAAEIWNILKGLVVQHSGERGRSAAP